MDTERENRIARIGLDKIHQVLIWAEEAQTSYESDGSRLLRCNLRQHVLQCIGIVDFDETNMGHLFASWLIDQKIQCRYVILHRERILNRWSTNQVGLWSRLLRSSGRGVRSPPSHFSGMNILTTLLQHNETNYLPNLPQAHGLRIQPVT